MTVRSETIGLILQRLKTGPLRRRRTYPLSAADIARISDRCTAQPDITAVLDVLEGELPPFATEAAS